MSAKTLTVIARLKAKPGLESEVRRALLSLIDPSRQHAGCINYDLHQGVGDPASFLFHENWTSREHLDQHLAQPEVKSVLGKVSEWVAEPPEITLWEKIG